MKKLLTLTMFILLSIAFTGCTEKTEAQKAEEAAKEAAAKMQESADEAAKALKKALN